MFQTQLICSLYNFQTNHPMPASARLPFSVFPQLLLLVSFLFFQNPTQANPPPPRLGPDYHILSSSKLTLTSSYNLVAIGGQSAYIHCWYGTE
ncbi:hypothetical protein E1A91_D07G201400v1 [Gossypium mustelinum]|uniref:Uncharacterized protein n=1 Tax=Gossypium mustelinum TaxID=34275 RepID=A0A5D2UC52_GOSMU|nr:hypothetical protein E1A91_D07G201400v1 [Gossypium mustelinum]